MNKGSPEEKTIYYHQVLEAKIVLGDSLYACEPVFEICRKNQWEFLIRYKDGSIPTLAKEYQEIKEMGK